MHTHALIHIFSQLYFLYHFQILREKLPQSTPKNKLIAWIYIFFLEDIKKVKVPAPNDY